MALYGGGINAAGAHNHPGTKDGSFSTREGGSAARSITLESGMSGMNSLDDMGGAMSGSMPEPEDAVVDEPDGPQEVDRTAGKGPTDSVREVPSTPTDAHVAHDDHSSGVTLKKLLERPSRVEALGISAAGIDASARSVNQIPHARGEAPNRGDVWNSLCDCFGTAKTAQDQNDAWAGLEEEAMTGSMGGKENDNGVSGRKASGHHGIARHNSNLSDGVAAGLVGFAKKAKSRSNKR